MGHGETQTADDTRSRLIEAAKAIVMRGDDTFSVAALCGEAGIEPGQFHDHFGGKTALMAALMHEEASQPVSEAPLPTVMPLPEPQTPKAEQEPSVSAPDAWLERRLRVFERALTALEAKADATAREHARRIALVEEKMAQLGGEPAERRLSPRPVMPEPAQDAAPMLQEDVPREDKEPAGEAAAPVPAIILSKADMADVLENARVRARAAAAAALEHEEKQPKNSTRRVRWLAAGALTLMILFLCIGFTLGNTASATQNDRLAEWQGAGISHRHVAEGALAQTMASADFGNAKAEARLALAYLRGQGITRDASAALRWSAAAAQAGEPVGEYLLGALYSQGEAVKPDPARAFGWFAASAAKGNLKAMHNLAIAYAEGQGTAKDEARAAQWFTAAAERGYVDSAFDLAVMYERGAGVPQDARRALTWYGIAAEAGDQPSRARAEFLRGQMTAADAKRAGDAAMAFAPLPALPDANAL